MWSLIKTGGIGLGILLVIVLVWLRSRRRGQEEDEEDYEPLELTDDMLAELDRLRVASTREAAVVDTAAMELEAAERQRVRGEISTMVAEKPDEVAAMLRGWMSEGKS
jgi:flagellar M-ring protein FliF